jgi:tetratricopeptide (TPR) repeat protein
MAAGTKEGPLLGSRYRVVERLGSGGMAAVYLAHDERLDRLVAVKRMHTTHGDEMDARRFEREAKIGASLSHPNLVSIFDTEQDEESVLLVMEYVDGETLADLLARGAVDPKRALKIVRAVAEALEHAHANGIVHRDIKPGNVLLGKDGSVKLADLGIAKAVERTEITGTGTVLGTPAYMAPEQLEGGELGPTVDVYALATMAFEMLTGKKARQGRTAVEIAHQVVNEQPPDARDFNPDIPRPAGQAIRAGMAKDAAERPASALAFAEQLERCFVQPPATVRQPATTRRIEEKARPVAPAPLAPRAKPPTVRPTAGSGARRPRWGLAVLGLLGVALVALVIGLSSGGGGDDPPAQRAADNDRQGQKKQGRERAGQPAAAAPADAVPTDTPALEGVPQPSGAGTSAEGRSLHLQGHAALERGDYDTAIALNTRAIEAFPVGTTYEDDMNYAYALFSLGKALRLAERPDEAIPVLEARLAIPNQQDTVQAELDAARNAAAAG